MKRKILADRIRGGEFDGTFAKFYGAEHVQSHYDRWVNLLDTHDDFFGDLDIRLFSTPGRTELAGNHTDHNKGCVLAGSINLDTIAAVSATDDNVIVLDSKGYPDVIVDLKTLTPIKSEEGTTNALIRGIAARFAEKGYKVGGFKANSTSTVLQGSGLSSSASLEVMIGTILSELYNEGSVSTTEIAQIGQYSENVFFNKPCGLMDQVACANGGVVSIDFADTEKPVITPVNYDFHGAGYSLMVVDTGGNHANLTPEYSAIPEEMKSVAAHFGKEVCREITEADLLSELKTLREKTGDRAILRAMHFFNDNKKVAAMVEALKNDKVMDYLNDVNRSGHSSFCFLQNVYPGKEPQEQGISLALALTEAFLDGTGACRVHGGGFAGTIQVYIPNDRAEDYIDFMKSFFGENAVTPLRIRPLPSMEVK